MKRHTFGAGANAFARGILLALGAPTLVVIIYVALLAVTVPFAAWLGQQLSIEISRSHPEGDTPEGIDAEWWLEFRRHATGLAATFTPNVIGFAAPLENLSAVLDATPRPLILIAPVVLYGVFSAWLWGGMLERLRRGKSIGIGAFTARSQATFWRVLVVNVIAIAAVALAYLVVHPLLFGPVSSRFAAVTASDAGRVTARVAAYLLFGGTLGAISVVADYARIQVVLGGAEGAGSAYRGAIALIRQRWRAVTMVALLIAMGFAALLVAYGVVDLQGGSRVGGWRAVGVAQVFILGRIVLRIVNAAAQVVVASPAAT